jgi:hypothetical protein
MPPGREYIIDTPYRHPPARASTVEHRTPLSLPPKPSSVYVRPAQPSMNGSTVSWQHRSELHDVWNMPSPPSYQGRFTAAMGSRTNPLSPRPRVQRVLTERPFSSGDGAQPPHHSHRRRGSSFTPTDPRPLSDVLITNVTWPPRGRPLDDCLMPREAQKLVCNGASTFKGWLDPVPYAGSGHYRLYAVMNEAHDKRSDRSDFEDEAFRNISLTITGNKTSFPWLCLEQPSMATRAGKYPGTTSLNYHIGLGGCLETPVAYGTNAEARPRSLFSLMDRLVHLQKGLETDSDKLYGQLYGKLIHDPDAEEKPHTAIEQQISDLITVLSNTQWIDFSQPKNQVLAKFFDAEDEPTRRHFFHQLLLATELYLRTHMEGHEEKAKRKLLLKLPPKIAWDLAVAQRWRENMTIKKKNTERKGKIESKFTFVSKTKTRQKEAMKAFAAALKWPNMDEVKYILEETDQKELVLEDRSAETASWFFGPLLPGRTLPWILMNALIDCDRDTQGALRYLTHLHPESGFQYRNNTYWSNESIVGKVLGAARGVNEIAGWIGPCISTTDLKRTECARVLQRPALEPFSTAADCQSISHRSDPLGPERVQSYPVEDFDLVVPDAKVLIDNVRVQKLRLDMVENQSQKSDGSPLLWKPVIDFAFGSRSVPMWLKHNVNFIAAYPCENPPHGKQTCVFGRTAFRTLWIPSEARLDWNYLSAAFKGSLLMSSSSAFLRLQISCCANRR